MSERAWNFYSAGRLIFGSGAVKRIAAAVRPCRVKRLLIVTDSTLVNAGLLDKVRRPLTDAGISVEVFEGGEPEPSISAARESVLAAQQFQPDGIVGLGGGSNMDVQDHRQCHHTRWRHPGLFWMELYSGTDNSARVRADNIGNGQRGVACRGVNRHGKSNESQHSEQLSATHCRCG